MLTNSAENLAPVRGDARKSLLSDRRFPKATAVVVERRDAVDGTEILRGEFCFVEDRLTAERRPEFTKARRWIVAAGLIEGADQGGVEQDRHVARAAASERDRGRSSAERQPSGRGTAR